jgi:hypothetical protein
MEAHYAREIQADLARHEKASLDAVDKALTAYRDGLAPVGATIETAVGAAMVASGFTAAEADHHRNVLIDLARILAEPGERVLGLGLMSYLLPAEVVVVLTHGFAVKTGSGTFRIDHDRETPSTTTEFGVHGLTLSTHLSLGDLHYYDAALLRPGGGRLPRLFLALRTQELTQTEHARPGSRARRSGRHLRIACHRQPEVGAAASRWPSSEIA